MAMLMPNRLGGYLYGQGINGDCKRSRATKLKSDAEAARPEQLVYIALVSTLAPPRGTRLADCVPFFLPIKSFPPCTKLKRKDASKPLEPIALSLKFVVRHPYFHHAS